MIANLLMLALSAGPTVGPSLPAAEKASGELEFDKAEKFYEQALEEPGTRDERLRAYKGLGMALAVQGEAKLAKAAFEKLLLLDPTAVVDLSMGPKIAKPYEQAKKTVAGKKNDVVLERDPEGAVTARLVEEVPLASTVRIFARVKGSPKFGSAGAPAGRKASLPFKPEDALEAYGEAIDAHEGVLFGEATASSPRSFAAVKVVTATAAVPAVDVAVETAKKESRHEGTAAASTGPGPGTPDLGDEEESSNWPIYLGVGAAVAGGIVAGVVFSQPPKLSMPTADRTTQLPAR